MKTFDNLMMAIGYALSIVIVVMLLTILIVSAKQGMDSGTLLTKCNTKYDRPCELIAVPKEVE